MKAVLLILALIPWQDKEDSTDPDIRSVSVDYDNVLLDKILADLQKRTGIPIEMTDGAREQLNPSKVTVSIKVEDMPLTSVLRLIILPRTTNVGIISVQKKKVLLRLRT